ncbi:MAG: hypothetical protein QNJ31_01735 [Candidatus Caenarcaniphilales bacterium]|nr:hypothetical protein [Candidatus Caenarcaniphilales bacterium]
MSQFNNQETQEQQISYQSAASFKQRKKTGPSPKYGPDQAKKMVSMRLSPDALNSIKKAAEIVFKDSQADVVEKMTRFFPPEALQSIFAMAKEFNVSPDDLVNDALELYKQNKLKVSV